MFYSILTNDVQAMGQARLLAPTCPAMLDETGAVAADVLRGLDSLFCENAIQAIADWTMPHGLPVTDNRDDRWRLASSLQKAIRRGDTLAAMRAAHACYAIDPAYLRKRLVVIAIEDVMLGNLLGVARTLALAGNATARRTAGDLKSHVWLAMELAAGGKDRTACNLVLLVDLDRSLHAKAEAWASKADEELSEIASQTERPMAERMMATWLHAGTKRFPNLHMPDWNDRPRGNALSLLARQRAPLLLCYLSDRAALRGGGCMHASTLPIWQMLQADENEVAVIHESIPVDPGLGQLLSCAYDMFTRPGQAAILRLASLPTVARALDAVQPGNRRGALFDTVFAVEGGLLSSHVSSPQLDAMNSRVDRLILEYSGVRTAADQTALMRAVESSLPELHHFRRDVVRAAIGERAGAGAVL